MSILQFPIKKQYSDDGKAHYVGQACCSIWGDKLIPEVDTSVEQTGLFWPNLIGIFRTGDTYYGIRVKSIN